jgi:hypothetical protein
MTRPAIIVHGLDHALAALAAARQRNLAVRLCSAPGAAGYLGAGYFRRLAEQAAEAFPGVPFEAVLDCGADPGLALNAFRHGIEMVRIDVPDALRARIADIAGQYGARLAEEARLDQEEGPVLDLFGEKDPQAACRRWLQHTHEDET